MPRLGAFVLSNYFAFIYVPVYNVNIVTHSGLSITHGATNEDETDGSLPTSALQRHTHSKGK